MARVTLRNASLCCLGVWAAIWFVFLLLRFTPFDIRVIPGIGTIMLTALAAVLVAPIVAIALAGAASLRQPRIAANWLTLGCAVAAFFAQALLFLVTRWL